MIPAGAASAIRAGSSRRLQWRVAEGSRFNHSLLMAYSSFREFLDVLEKAGELKRINLPVDTDLVITEWANREMKSPGGGKALLFEKPLVNRKTSKFPVAINTMGSDKRMALALRVNDVEDVARDIQLILKAKPP